MYRIISIQQLDNFSFCIEWEGNEKKVYFLKDLQQNCPCASCKLAKTQPCVDQNVQAHRVFNVGRYGLKIEFTSGCSQGIYSYKWLKDFNAIH
ncbi:MAG: hypothetical protein BGO10_03710 [Chlamydia sp. 32-24]|nr:MAG: hypothetical protein BGO10_03710 [Chlamydia sp. 32-24]